ncbi:MAG: polyamine aminopropyltransferase [Sandaracinaceae bacterium]|nr:polyamine aminopropyltransferase [Sandaracinaceae bacterium]
MSAAEPSLKRKRAPLLFLTVLVIATAGLVYELVAGTVASYLLGDSVFQFSTVIGVYLSAMGLGAYLSRFVRERLATRFVEVELAAALAGGVSAPLLSLVFAYGSAFQVVLYAMVVTIGALVGLELPLLMRILREELAFEELVAKVLTFDYLGALVGSLLFAMVLMPGLGLVRTSLLFGMLNCAVGIASTWLLSESIWSGARLRLRIVGGALFAGLLGAFVWHAPLAHFAEDAIYGDPIVLARQTPYQRIVVTNGALGLALFLNGNLQFSSLDEHRYHEALVHPAFAAAGRRERVLVLGGGDGLALREILRYPEVREVTLVDLDPAMTELARELPALRAMNAGSLSDPRVRVINDDAMVWLDEADRGRFDVVIVDFPDPNDFSLGKLYTTRFYALARRAMHAGSVLVVQSTSPLAARRSFWCIERTLRASGLHTAPYHVAVPTFGEWGFVLARTARFDPPERLAPAGSLRYLDDATLRALFVFPRDMRAPDDLEINRLDTQALVQYYHQEWSRLE